MYNIGERVVWAYPPEPTTDPAEYKGVVTNRRVLYTVKFDDGTVEKDLSEYDIRKDGDL